MDKLEDIRIIGRDKERSDDKGTLSEDGLQLGMQVFRLSHVAPEEWRAIFNGIFLAEPGRLGREGRASETTIHLWGGPYIFDQTDVEHLKELVSYTNSRYQEMFMPAGDVSGLDAFGD